jgi:hypothetical protein
MLQVWPTIWTAHDSECTVSLSGNHHRKFHAARKKNIPIMQHQRAILNTNKNLASRVSCRSATNSATLSCINCGANVAIELAFLSSSMVAQRAVGVPRWPSKLTNVCHGSPARSSTQERNDISQTISSTAAPAGANSLLMHAFRLCVRGKIAESRPRPAPPKYISRHEGSVRTNKKYVYV